MDWKRLDQARRSVGPVEVNLIEAYAQGRIKRRDFVKRGAMIGLSVPFMGAIIAACGDDDDDASSDTQAASGDSAPGTEAAGGTDAPAGAAGGNLIIGIQQGDVNTGLDPVNMLDLGTYAITSQSFDYLVGLQADGNIGTEAGTGLAESWEPNEDGSVWTFTLRDGPVWSDGSPVTSADVAATMDRLAAAGNSGLTGVIEEGAVDSSDPKVAVFTLTGPNGNFPSLVSYYNAQALITPADYSDGTTLDERPEGSGAWILDEWDPTTFVARFVKNPNWWGGEVLLDSTELRGFADISTTVTAMQSRDIDMIQQFPVIGGESLLNDGSLVVTQPPSATHRQVWFNIPQGQFGDVRLRQALAYTLDREQMNQTLWAGRGIIANDHPVHPDVPFYDPEAVPQRSRDIEMARQLMSDAGVDSVTVTLETGDLQEIPDFAAIIQQNAAEAGWNITVNTQSNSTFYGAGAPWACPNPSESDPAIPCDGAAEFGIVDYGHRDVPDLYFNAQLSTGGVWNVSNYSNPDYDALLDEYRSAVDVESLQAATGQIQQIINEDVPAAYAYFFPYLGGHDESVSGVQTTALGHLIVGNASKA